MKKGEDTPLGLVIADRDWCVRIAQFDDVIIKRGSMGTDRTAFALFDFTMQDSRSVLYEHLDDASREGDAITLHISGGRVVNLEVRVPRPARASQVGRFGLTVLDALAHVASSDDSAGYELRSEQRSRDSEEWWKKNQTADAFVASILNFFLEVIDEKRKLAKD